MIAVVSGLTIAFLELLLVFGDGGLGATRGLVLWGKRNQKLLEFCVEFCGNFG